MVARGCHGVVVDDALPMTTLMTTLLMMLMI